MSVVPASAIASAPSFACGHALVQKHRREQRDERRMQIEEKRGETGRGERERREIRDRLAAVAQRSERDEHAERRPARYRVAADAQQREHQQRCDREAQREQRHRVHTRREREAREDRHRTEGHRGDDDAGDADVAPSFLGADHAGGTRRALLGRNALQTASCVSM